MSAAVNEILTIAVQGFLVNCVIWAVYWGLYR